MNDRMDAEICCEHFTKYESFNTNRANSNLHFDRDIVDPFYGAWPSAP